MNVACVPSAAGRLPLLHQGSLYEQQEQSSPTVRPFEKDQNRDVTMPALRECSGGLGFPRMAGLQAGQKRRVDASTHWSTRFAPHCCTATCRNTTPQPVAAYGGSFFLFFSGRVGRSAQRAARRSAIRRARVSSGQASGFSMESWNCLASHRAGCGDKRLLTKKAPILSGWMGTGGPLDGRSRSNRV